MRRSIAATTAAVALAAALAGCSDSDPAAAPPATSQPTQPTPSAQPVKVTPEAVAWMGEFCGAVVGLTKPPEIAEPQLAAGDFAGGKQALDQVFVQLTNYVNPSIVALGRLSAAPLPAGDAAKKDLIDALTTIRDRVTGAQTKLDAAAVGDQQALLAAGKDLDAVIAGVNALEDPSGTLPESPELTAAAGQAPSCEKLAG
jgi:hypothetical protein